VSRLPITLRLPLPRRARRGAPAFAPDTRPDAAHFAAPTCRNCGAAQATRYCGECGQEKASRFGPRAVGGEAWQAWRWFELDVLRSAWRLLTGPGHVARDYVLGARKRHVHPLKLLLAAIGVLLLVMTHSQALDSTDAAGLRVMEQLRAWSNWSFSFGIPALFAACWLAFRRRGGFNATELLVLTVYAQFLVLCASILYRLPTLLWRAPEFLAAHRAAAPWVMDLAGALVLAVACLQFFRLEPSRGALRLACAAALYVALKWLLQRGYAWLLVTLLFGRPA
jgi:hypothetical protein